MNRIGLARKGTLRDSNIYFQSPPGTVVSNLQFQPGQSVRIGGHLSGAVGIGEPFVPVQLQIVGANNEFNPIYVSSNTNIWGDWYFDVTMPNVTARATVQVSFQMPVEPINESVNISIGNIAPAPTPPPSGSFSINDWIIIGIVALAAILIFRK